MSRARWAALLLVAGALVGGVPGGAGAQLPRRPAPDPQELQEPRRAPLTITPSLSVTEEFNDNVLLNNDNKRYDFITGFTPGVEIAVERPTYRLAAGYNFTAEVYARDSRRNHAFDRQNFALDGLYRATPRLTFTLTDTFSFNTDTNLIAAEEVATSRDDAWGNTVAPGVTFLLTPRTTLRALGSYTIQRFEREDLRESDVYRAEGSVEHAFTPRLGGTLGYQFGYFDIDAEGSATSHTPRLGLVYRVTERLTGSLSGGPSVVVTDDETTVVPAATAGLRYRVFFGSVGASYDRGVGTAGGLGGVTENQSVGVTAQVITLLRGLVLDGAARYRTSESIEDDSIDISGVTLNVTATYRLTAWMNAVASYTFFHQDADTTLRSRLGAPLANDVDQNRLFVGLQFLYPIRFD